MSRKKIVRSSSYDVARKAGVSQATVSRVFNESDIFVNPETREKVLAAATEIGYHPNRIARSLNSQSTKIVGIVMKRFDSLFYMNVLGLFVQKFERIGYSVMVFNFDNERDVEKNLDKSLEYNVSGVIMTSASLTSPLVEGFQNLGTPLFLFNRISEGVNVNTLCCDNYDGGGQVAAYLMERGHKKPVYFSGKSGTSTNRDRQKGFVEGVKRCGIGDVPVFTGNFGYDSGFEAAKSLHLSGLEFDSIFCASDYMAMGAMDFFRYKTELTIPNDFSLIGFDGLALKNSLAYPISTLEQPVEKMVDKTVELMISKIKKPESETVHTLICGEIFSRGSVSVR